MLHGRSGIGWSEYGRSICLDHLATRSFFGLRSCAVLFRRPVEVDHSARRRTVRDAAIGARLYGRRHMEDGPVYSASTQSGQSGRAAGLWRLSSELSVDAVSVPEPHVSCGWRGMLLQAVLSSGVIDLPLVWQPLGQLADG